MEYSVLKCEWSGGPSVGNDASSEPLRDSAGALSIRERDGLFGDLQRVWDTLPTRAFHTRGSRGGSVLRGQTGALHLVAQDHTCVVPRRAREPRAGADPEPGDPGWRGAAVVRPWPGELAAGRVRKAGGDSLAFLRGRSSAPGFGVARVADPGSGAARRARVFRARLWHLGRHRGRRGRCLMGFGAKDEGSSARSFDD